MSSAAAPAPEAAAPVFPPAVFVHIDIPEESRVKCVEYTLEALAKFKVEKDQATHVKKSLEAWNGALWIVVIGTAFGASVAHENAGLCMFRIGKVHVLCFQSYDESTLINTKKAAVPRPEAAKPEGGAAETAEEAKAE
jgi:hypothetical protein